LLRSFCLGKAFGIPLYVNPTLLLLPAWVIYASRGQGLISALTLLAVVVVLFGCVLLHELGHALMARYFGIATRDITLYPIGGIARLDSTGERPIEEVCIALAGPAVNVIILALLLPVVMLALVTGHLGGGEGAQLFTLERGWLSLLGLFTLWVWFGNLTLVLFNLIPVFPMDGGRVFRALLSFGMPRLRATEIAVPIGVVGALLIALAGAFYFHNPILVLVSLFVPFAGHMELQGLRRMEAERRAAATAGAVPVEPTPEPAPDPTRGFTGFTWDRERRVWVHWFNGKPVDVA
jgi:Zn-dependent protease